jgi:hypothetical protein
VTPDSHLNCLLALPAEHPPLPGNLEIVHGSTLSFSDFLQMLDHLTVLPAIPINLLDTLVGKCSSDPERSPESPRRSIRLRHDRDRRGDPIEERPNTGSGARWVLGICQEVQRLFEL